MPKEKNDLYELPEFSKDYEELIDSASYPNPSLEDYFRKVEKMDSVLQKTFVYSQLIPDMGNKFERMGNKLVELSSQFSGMSSRVSKMEVRLEKAHDCMNREVIRDMILKLDYVRGEVAGFRELQTRIGQLEQSRKQTIVTFLGSLFALFSTIGSLIWFLSGISRDIQHESETRQRQIAEVIEEIRRNVER